MVCMESMTTRSGCTSLMCVKMVSSEFSQRIMKLSESSEVGASLSARIFSWCALSSPLT